MPTWIIIVIIIFSLLTLFVVLSYLKLKKATNDTGSFNLLHLSDSDFQKTISKGVTLVDFWADWCMPCKLLGPTISNLADNNADKAKVAKLNIETYQKIAAINGISSIPTVVVFKNGKEVERSVSVKPKHYYQSMIDKALNK